MGWAAVNKNPDPTMACVGQPSLSKANPASSIGQISEQADQLSCESHQDHHVKRKALADIQTPNALNGLHSSPAKSFSDFSDTAPSTPRLKRRKNNESPTLAQSPPKSSFSKKTKRRPGATRTPQSPKGDNRSCKSSNSAQQQCGSRHKSTAGSFEGVHVPAEDMFFEATASGQSSLALPSLRKQPPRESKTMRSIENEVNPHDGRDTLYGWDEPTVYDASYIEQRKREDRLNGIRPGESPAHEPDRPFTPVSTPSVSDADTTPSNRRHGARANSPQDDDQFESLAVSERCTITKHDRGRSLSPSARFKREVTEAVEDASTFLYRNAFSRDIDVAAIVAQFRGLERQIAALKRLVEEKEDLDVSTRRDCERILTNIEDLIRRSVLAPCSGLLGAPESINDAPQGQENASSTSSADGLDLMSVDNVSGNPQSYSHVPLQSLLENPGSHQPKAANRTAVPHAQGASLNAKDRPRNQPRRRNQSTPRGRSTKPNGHGKRQRSGGRSSHARPGARSQSFSVPSIPPPQDAKGPTSTGPRSARRRGSGPSSTPRRQPFGSHREANRPKTRMEVHASSSSRCKQRHNTTASNHASKPDVRKTVVYAAGRGPFPQNRTEDDPRHGIEEKELQNSTPNMDKGKQRALYSDYDQVTQKPEHLNGRVSASEAVNARSRGTSEFPRVQTVLQRDKMYREQARQPAKAHRAEPQADLQASNTAQGHNTQATSQPNGKISSYARRRNHEVSSFPQRRPFNTNGPIRELSLPQSTIQRWNREQCGCIHLPDMFRNTLRPNLASWPGIKDQFLHHCEQVMNCPAHPEVTRRTCRELHLVEAPVHKREMEQWQHDTLRQKGLLTHGTIVANAFYGNQAPRALSRQPHDLPQAVDPSDKFEHVGQNTVDVRVRIEEPQPSSPIVREGPIFKTSPTLAGLAEHSFQHVFGLPTPLGSSSPLQLEASQVNQGQDADDPCPSSPSQPAASAEYPNPQKRKIPTSPSNATGEYKGKMWDTMYLEESSPDNYPHGVTKIPTRKSPASTSEKRRSPSSISTGARPIKKLSSITRLSNEQVSGEAFNHLDGYQLPDMDDDDVTRLSLPPSDQSAISFAGEGTVAFQAQSDPSSSSHQQGSEFDEADSETLPPGPPDTTASSLPLSQDSGAKEGKRKGRENEGKMKEKVGEEPNRYGGQEAARVEEKRTTEEEEKEGEEKKKKQKKKDRRERKRKKEEEANENHRKEQMEAKKDKKKRKEKKGRKEKRAANAEALHNPTADGDGSNAQVEPFSNHGIAEQENTDRGPTTQGAIVEMKPEMVQRTLCKPWLIPYAERVSDAELIRIGRLTSPEVRYWAARYAFRTDGKLRVGYHHLVKKKDQDGDGWDEDLKMRLLPEK
ncbi:MAG: hypothetical protein Q9184_005513 [Pyrenodesmia sp. 2 TL-2023]